MTQSDQSGGDADAQRREVDYHGRVQGVGFRYTARQVAAHFRVTGYVMNLPDGRVHLVVEGNGKELDRFLNSLEAAMAGYIESREVRRRPASGEFEEFGIRHY